MSMRCVTCWTCGGMCRGRWIPFFFGRAEGEAWRTFLDIASASTWGQVVVFAPEAGFESIAFSSHMLISMWRAILGDSATCYLLLFSFTIRGRTRVQRQMQSCRSTCVIHTFIGVCVCVCVCVRVSLQVCTLCCFLHGLIHAWRIWQAVLGCKLRQHLHALHLLLRCGRQPG